MRSTLIILFIFCITFFGFSTSIIRAFEITSDPQYVVMNFATINELNWAAPEPEWQQVVKPKILSQIHELTSALPPGNNGRKLAWSTLMEYMNFPLDTPNKESPYAIKMRRILEITDAINLPVFIPLNGFQWWDNLPELYNWWDSDGTHTDPAFFARQKDPIAFKQRFINGFDPNNKWNVEWQDWQTPMKLSYRNWGGGGFRLAPPPNLSSSNNRAKLSYQTVLLARLKVILNEITPFLNKWQSENRSSLFAGLTVGTEISLNASTKPEDEFLPYGFRAVQDELCPENSFSCGTSTKFSNLQIDSARRHTVNTFLVNLTHTISNFNIPKERIYTHVWGEALPGEPRHVNYADTAYTLYSRPGMSFYGYAKNPLSLPDWFNALKSNGYPAWGAVEYSAGKNSEDWTQGLTNSFDNEIDQAKVMTIYNWQEHKDTKAITALAKFLSETPKSNNCQLPEIVPLTANHALNPKTFQWKYILSPQSGNTITLHIKSGIKTNFDAPNIFATTLETNKLEFELPKLPFGHYSWYLETAGCGERRTTSVPLSFIVLPEIKNNNPNWLEWTLNQLDKISLNAKPILPN